MALVMVLLLMFFMLILALLVKYLKFLRNHQKLLRGNELEEGGKIEKIFKRTKSILKSDNKLKYCLKITGRFERYIRRSVIWGLPLFLLMESII